MSGESAPPAPRFRRPWTSWGLLAVAVAIAWLWRAQIGGDVVHFGNHDRLNFELTHELFNFDSRAANGRMAGWDDRTFGGIDHGALPSVGGNLSPLKMVMPWVDRAGLYRAAGLIPFALMLAAGAAAYLALRAIASPVASATGAVAYVTATFSQLNFSQMDMAALLLVALPAGTWVLSTRPPGVGSLAGLTLCFLPVAYLGFAPQSAYLCSFWGLLALQRCHSLRSWRPLLSLAAAFATALALCWPRLAAVAGGLAGLKRGIPGMDRAPDFGELQAYFNVTGREFLRWFEDGLFGRFPQEAAAWGNNLNLNEGFQLYSSTFATLLALVALARYRGTWLGAFHPRHGLVACSAWTLVGVLLVVFASPVTYLVHRLFLSAPIIHARIVIIAILPAAVLAAAALDDFAAAAPGPSMRRRVVGILAGVLLAAVAAAVLHPVSQKSAVALPTPTQLEVRRPQSRNLHLRWHGAAPEYEIEMRRGAGAFAPIGRSSEEYYEVGDVAFDDAYSFRVRGRSGALASEFSTVATAPAGILTPPMVRNPDGGPWVHPGRLAKLGASAALFALLLAARPLLGRLPGGLHGAAAGLAVLASVQALGEADFRANGPHTRSFPIPFAGDNFFNTPAGTLEPPDAEALARIHSILEPERWRTAFLTPQSYYGFAVPHLAHFWQLRVIEGYLTGIPPRIAALPWPPGTLSLRTLSFRREEDLPWPLLGLLNVRHAVAIDAPLYFNTERKDPLVLLTNPAPVVPREFFARRTAPAAPFGSGPIRLPSDPRQESLVEGLTAPREWAAEGAIHARHGIDRATLEFEPADTPRFLVLNDLYHPGWRAFTGTGDVLQIHPTNTCMRGVEVPPGITTIHFEFKGKPSPVATRWAATGALGLFLLGACALNRRVDHPSRR